MTLAEHIAASNKLILEEDQLPARLRQLSDEVGACKRRARMAGAMDTVRALGRIALDLRLLANRHAEEARR